MIVLSLHTLEMDRYITIAPGRGQEKQTVFFRR